MALCYVHPFMLTSDSHNHPNEETLLFLPPFHR